MKVQGTQTQPPAGPPRSPLPHAPHLEPLCALGQLPRCGRHALRRRDQRVARGRVAGGALHSAQIPSAAAAEFSDFREQIPRRDGRSGRRRRRLRIARAAAAAAPRQLAEPVKRCRQLPRLPCGAGGPCAHNPQLPCCPQRAARRLRHPPRRRRGRSRAVRGRRAGVTAPGAAPAATRQRLQRREGREAAVDGCSARAAQSRDIFYLEARGKAGVRGVA